MNTAHGFTLMDTENELKYKIKNGLIINLSVFSASISELIKRELHEDVTQ